MKQILILVMLISFKAQGQEKIEGTIAFQSDPAKKYAIYVPSSYDENTPSELVLGLHPFNTNRWDAIAWRDTLTAFAESNNVLLICPDGGPDGKVDDPIDTAFTSFVLDSMMHWYNVDESKVFALGFSWGALTTYTYGLNHADRFAGFMPIGAAINGYAPIQDIETNAKDKSFYIIHGSSDNPNTRFFPLKDGLENIGACVESNLLTGVGHTIDFDNRNELMTEGLNYLRNTICSDPLSDDNIQKRGFNIYPNPSTPSDQLNIELDSKEIQSLKILNRIGQVVHETNFSNTVDLKAFESGVYYLILESNNGTQKSKSFIIY